ncbi:LOB domain-containing protein 1 [Linum perenne]
MPRCAGCVYLRRRCVQDCLLAPYFPPDNPQRFESVHKIFGTSNITRLLLGVPEEFRGMAADCMSFEADARVRDPVYGCTRMIYQLQKEILMMRLELGNLNMMIALLSAQHQQHQQEMTVDDIDFEANNFGFEDCPLAPYFPPDNPQILESVHKIYGTSNLTKLLLEMPEEFRRKAADCMSFEVDARVRDPVYGCTRMIYQLQKEILMMRLELNNLNSMIALLSAQHQQHQ